MLELLWFFSTSKIPKEQHEFVSLINRDVKTSGIDETWRLIEKSSSFGNTMNIDTQNTRFFLYDFYSTTQTAITARDMMLELYSCVFTNCQSTNGGALKVDNRSLLVNSCRFTKCSASVQGGAIYFSYGKIELFRTEFIGCSVTVGYNGTRGKNSPAIVFHVDFLNTEPNFFVSCLFTQTTDLNTLYLVSLSQSYNLAKEYTHEFHFEFCRFDRPTLKNSTYIYDESKDEELYSKFIAEFRNNYNADSDTVWKQATRTFSPTATASISISPSSSPSPSPSASASPSASVSLEPSPSLWPTRSYTPESIDPGMPTRTPFVPQSPVASSSPMPTHTMSPYPTQTPSPLPSPTASRSPLPSTPPRTPTPSQSPGPTPIPLVTWESLSIGLGIFFGLITVIGLILMCIYMFMLCNPVQTMARQIVQGDRDAHCGCCGFICC